MLCEYRPQNDKDVMSMNTQKVFDSIVNIDDVLEVITFSTSDSSTPTYTTDSPIPTQDKKPSQATASASPEVDLLDLSDFSVSIPMVSSPVPPISLKPVDSASTQISEEAPKGQPKKKLGANIQVSSFIDGTCFICSLHSYYSFSFDNDRNFYSKRKVKPTTLVSRHRTSI